MLCKNRLGGDAEREGVVVDHKDCVSSASGGEVVHLQQNALGILVDELHGGEGQVVLT